MNNEDNKKAWGGDSAVTTQPLRQDGENLLSSTPVHSEAINQLAAERDALAATVEALRKIFPLKVLIGCDGHLNYPVSQYNGMVEAFNARPQQHLRDVRAEAGRAGFIAGYNQAQSDPFTANDTEIDLYADEYAASVMVGEK